MPIRRCLSRGAIRLALATFTALPLLAADADAAVVRLSPAADTYVRADAPRASFGSSPRLSAQGPGRRARRAYLRFEVDLPADVTVTRATLWLFTLSDDDGRGVILRSAGHDLWRSAGLSWRRQPLVGAVVDRQRRYRRHEWIALDATPVAREGGTVTLALTTRARSWQGFRSSEARSHRPRLVIATKPAPAGGAPGSGSAPAAPALPVAAPASASPAAPAPGPLPSPAPAPSPSPASVTVAAAGDIAAPQTSPGSSSGGQWLTDDLLDAIKPDAVLTLGDQVYDTSTLSAFNSYYTPNWGRYRNITYPTNGGSHDFYGTGDWFTYFNSGPAHQQPEGSYSFDLGAWHLIALNSYCWERSSCDETQWTNWLKSDLAAHPTACTLAYYHEPYWTTPSSHGRDTALKPWIKALYDAGVDVVLQAHNHGYERFAPQDPDDHRDDARGMVAFTVGTGGRSFYPYSGAAANSQVRNSNTFGVLRLTLNPTSFDFAFVPIAGRTFTDSGSVACH